MKKINIAAGIVMLVAIVMLVMSTKDVSSYANFKIAESSTSQVTIVGELNKLHEVVYDPETAPNEYSFHMTDKDGVTKRVIVKEPRPRDFEKTESITATGILIDDVFHAENVLLKCPSKYQEEELALRKES